MSDIAEKARSGKAHWTRNRAIIVMVVGGIMFGLSIVIPAESGTTLHTSKVVVGAIGFCLLCYGSYKRPMKAVAGEMIKS